MSMQAVIFDYGNTLVYEQKDWRASERKGVKRLVEALRVFGIILEEEPFSRVLLAIRAENFRQARETWMEVPAVESLAQALKEFGVGTVTSELLNRGIEAYFHPEEENSRLLPGVPEALRILSYQGFQLGLVSNATTALLIRRILELHGVLHWFRTVVISAEVGYRKPKPEIFELALAGLGVKSDQTVFVGDRPDVDIVGAKTAGIRSILLKAVESVHVAESEAKPDRVASSISKVVEIVAEIADTSS